MEVIFIDTSAWIAIYDKKDKYHIKAKSILEKLKKHKKKLITTDYIFDETLTAANSGVGYNFAVKIGEIILNNTVAEIIDLEKEDKKEAWEIFKKYGGMKLSFTDCTSFAFMKDRKIDYAFTFDEDFKKMGFKVYE